MPEYRCDRKAYANVNPESIADGYFRYMEALCEAHLKGQERYEAAYRKYVEAISTSLHDIPNHELARRYVEGLQDAWKKQDARRYIDARYQYARWVHEESSGLQNRSEETSRKFVGEVHQIWSDTQESQNTEFHKFLTVVQDTLGKVDANAVDVPTIAVIGQSLCTAAYIRPHDGPKW